MRNSNKWLVASFVFNLTAVILFLINLTKMSTPFGLSPISYVSLGNFSTNLAVCLLILGTGCWWVASNELGDERSE